MSSTPLTSQAAAARVAVRRGSLTSASAHDLSLRAWWLGAMLFAALAAAVLLCTLEWEYYRRLLRWRQAEMTTGDRAIMGWLLWSKSVLPLLPVLVVAGLTARLGRRKLATALLALGGMLVCYWLAADLVMQNLTGNHLLDYWPYVEDALRTTKGKHLEWAGDADGIGVRFLLVLAAVVATILGLLRGAGWIAGRLASTRWLLAPFSGVACTGLFAVAILAAIPAQALFSHPLLLRRLHTAMPVDLALFVPRADDPLAIAAWLGGREAADFERGVRIVALVPDPAEGDDAGHEQATLHNFSEQPISIEGWRLRDRAGSKHLLHGALAGGQSRTIVLPAGNLVMENDADELYLDDERGRQRHKVKYKVEMVKYGSVINFREEGDLDEFMLKLNQGVQSVYHTMRKDVLAPRPVDEQPRIDAPNPPHVVYLVLESFREQAVSPALMQRLDAWGRRGLRLGRHYAGSNSSHLGLFTLLYGRSPLVYDPTVMANIPPQTAYTLRGSGYQTTYLTSGDYTNFRKMDRFLNEEHFDRVIVENGPDFQSWPDRDRKVLFRVQDILAKAERPQFVMAFLMSTHFPYAFPPEWNRYQPSATEQVNHDNWRSFDAQVLHNRYKNAALSLEEGMMRLIDSLDPARHIIVVTGDHGESMSEDGALAHASRGSEVQTRVPMLMVGPGLEPRVIHEPTLHTDVLPTLLHALAGHEMALRHAHGRDLLNASPLADEVMIFPFRWKDPYDLIVMRGSQRMQFRIRLDRAWIETYGYCDTEGNLDLGSAHPCTPQDAVAWTEAFRREMLRLTP